MLSANDVKLLSSHLPFWHHLSQEESLQLLNGTKAVQYMPNENIHSPSNECVGVLFIKSGKLRSYMLSENGREITLFRLNAGDFCVLSASCLLQSITFDVFIDAQIESEVLLMNAAHFSKLQSSRLDVENFALRLATERFSDVMWAMQQLLFMRFDTRLAIFLLDEAAQTGQNSLPLTHEQIAKYIGSAREVVSRMLRYFANEGIVRLSRSEIELVDKQALQKLAQG